MKHTSLKQICMTALLAACCYIGFMYLKINIPVGDMMTAIHFGNAFCVLGALLLGGVSGGLAGAIGMGLADLMDPLYVSSFPKTFLLKLLIGLVTGFIAHHIIHIQYKHEPKQVFKGAIIASSCGMLCNVILEPIVSFFYKNYILGVPMSTAKLFAAFTAGTTFINAITSVIIASLLYRALYRYFNMIKK